MSRDRDHLATRLFDICVGILLASMALYAAVQVMKMIWLPLCIGSFVLLAVSGVVWLAIGRNRRW